MARRVARRVAEGTSGDAGHPRVTTPSGWRCCAAGGRCGCGCGRWSPSPPSRRGPPPRRPPTESASSPPLRGRGRGCHRSRAGDTHVPSRSGGVNTGDALWMGTSLRATLRCPMSPLGNGVSTLGTSRGWRCHHRHPGDNLVPSQLWGINVEDHQGMGTSLRAILGSLVSSRGHGQSNLGTLQG